MPRYAVIDIGTNSVKMTVADVDSGAVWPQIERSEITRLGRGVDQSKRLTAESMLVTHAAIQRFANEAREIGASEIKSCGTSALRDAQNGGEFIERIAEITGGNVEIISGDREARLSYAAAVSDPSVTVQCSTDSILVFDVGGGSTELILGSKRDLREFKSIDIGAVRLTERAFKNDPPPDSELSDARKIVSQALEVFPIEPIGGVIGTGGTAISVRKMLLKNGDVQASCVSYRELHSLIEKLAKLPNIERREVQGLEPARADVIVAGMLIIEAILDRFRTESFIVSTRGVRYGLLLEMAKG